MSNKRIKSIWKELNDAIRKDEREKCEKEGLDNGLKIEGQLFDLVMRCPVHNEKAYCCEECLECNMKDEHQKGYNKAKQETLRKVREIIDKYVLYEPMNREMKEELENG